MDDANTAQGSAMQSNEHGLQNIFKAYEVHNRTEGKSPSTVEWYNEVLGLFWRWMVENGTPLVLESLSEALVREFILYLQSRPGRRGNLSNNTISNRVRALRAFFAWLERSDYTETHLLRRLRPPKTVQHVIETLSEEEVDRLLAYLKPKARDLAMVSLMLDTGVRVSETATLQEKDLHLEEGYIKVLGKGGKERTIGFGQRCQRAVSSYLYRHRSRPAHNGVDTFFLTTDGYPISIAGIQSMFVRLAKQVGIPRLHPHLLRHTYATSFLSNGGNVFLLKQGLGVGVQR